MPIESATYPSQLNPSNPTSSDDMGAGDDQIRLVKTTIVNAFGQIAGAVTATHTELNYTDGVTSNIQTQLDAKAPKVDSALTGTTSAQFVNINAGTLGLQKVFMWLGSGGAQQWAVVQEGDRTLAFYSYDDAGNYQGVPINVTRAGSMTVSGLIYGRGGGSGLGRITVSTSDPSGGEDGDWWIKVAP